MLKFTLWYKIESLNSYFNCGEFPVVSLVTSFMNKINIQLIFC